MYESCLVRQPIFDRSRALLGYEIRFRDSEDGRHAFAQSFLSGTYDLVRGGLPGFVTCTRAQIIERSFMVSDPKSTILLIPREVGPDEDVLLALGDLRKAGGRVALDDLIETPSPSEALAPLASFVRIDVRVESTIMLGRICDRVTNKKAKLIADHVEEAAQYEATLQLGFDGFEGTFFSRPEPLPAADLPSSTVAAMRLLGLARDEKITDRDLEAAISVDPVLTFQLLRLVNSAAIGARGVDSIGQALRLIGRNAFLRWLSLAIAASRQAKTGVDQHLVRQAVERGRLMEQLGNRTRDAGTLFLVGLFSLLDAVFRMPLPDIVGRVALSDDAKEALLERTGPYADALAFAESYELGLFESATELAKEMGIDPDKVPALYADAIAWTAAALAPLTESKGSRAGTR